MLYRQIHGKVTAAIIQNEKIIYHGELTLEKDVVTFQGSDLESLAESFKESVDDYLKFCQSRGERPNY